MNKRPGFIVTVLVFILAIGGFYFYLKHQQSPMTQPIHAIPVNSSIIVEIKNPTSFISNVKDASSFFKKISKLNEIKQPLNNVLNIDSLVKSNEILLDIFNERELLVSVHEMGNNDFEVLYLCKLSGRHEANQLFKIIGSELPNNYEISHSRYNQVRIYNLKENNKTSIFYCFHRGVLMASSSDILIKSAVRQVESETGLINSADFTRLMKTAGKNVDANIYVQFKEANGLIEGLFSRENLKENNISRVGNWLEIDLILKNNTVLLNGFATTSKEADFINIFKGQSPVNMKFVKFVPAGVNNLFAFGITDYSLFKQNLQVYMEQNNQIERYQVNHNNVRSVFGSRAEQQLKDIFRNELAQVTLSDGNSLFYVRTKGYRDGIELIQNWLKFYCQQTNQSVNSFKTDYKIDADSKFPIYTIPIDYLPARWFGPWFKSCKGNYATVFDDYIIFSSNYKVLTRIIYENVLEKTLNYDGAYNQFSDFLSTKVNLHAFVSLESKSESFEKIVSDNAYKYYLKNESVLKDFYGVGWQFSVENDLMYNNILFRHQPSNAIKAATEWETRLDTIVSMKPELVKNHYTGEKEIFVQDENNNIYLINKSGRTLWKKQINNQLIGSIHQVDYYKNGKLQFLFNTNNEIHLIDRNGNNVDRYPIKLPVKTNQPMAVFDYDNRKNYRLFIAGTDRKVYAFSIKAKRIAGFGFKGSDNNIISPVQYFRDNNKDYLVVTDSSRVYILNRKGQSRVKLKKQFNPSVNNIFTYQPGNSTRKGRLLRTDNTGKIYFIYFTGEVEEKEIGVFSNQHYFEVNDVTGDNIYDFIYIDNNEMSVYSLSGKKHFDYKFKSPIKHSASFYKFSSKNIAIGITETDKQQIYLFDKEGNIFEGFPLVGKTKFSIGFLEKTNNKFSLIVGGDDQYLYNYKLN